MLFKANQMPPVLSTSNQPQSLNSGLGIPQPVPPVLSGHFPSISQDVDLRSAVDIRNNVDPRLTRNMDLDMRAMAGNASGSLDSNYMRPTAQPQPASQRQLPISAPFQSDPRQRGDPRVKQQSSAMPIQQAPSSQPSAASRFPSGGIPNDASDQEKAALIMQVLQLSDEQISMLPPEQRNSIMMLKEQIAKSTQR